MAPARLVSFATSKRESRTSKSREPWAQKRPRRESGDSCVAGAGGFFAVGRGGKRSPVRKMVGQVAPDVCDSSPDCIRQPGAHRPQGRRTRVSLRSLSGRDRAGAKTGRGRACSKERKELAGIPGLGRNRRTGNGENGQADRESHRLRRYSISKQA